MPALHASGEKTTLTSIANFFNLKNGRWSKHVLRGVSHPGVAYYSTAVINNDAFFFGGSCGHASCYYNGLTAYDSAKQKWKEVRIINPLSGPIKKYSAGMVPFKYLDRSALFVMGGYGELSGDKQAFSDYNSSTGNPTVVRTNEQHIFLFKPSKY